MSAETQGTFTDGWSATEHPVSISLHDGELRYKGPSLPETVWVLRSVRTVDRQIAGAPLQLSHLAQYGARLTIADKDFAALLVARLPYLKGAFNRGSRGKPMAWILGTIATIAVAGFLVLQLGPRLLAPLLPDSMITSLGDLSELGLMGSARQCNKGEGRSAIAAMVARFTEADPNLPSLTVKVFDHSAMNAWALPGGRIILTRGLIEEAGNPEEVAGVLAHEIGHAVRRHSEEQIVRQFGLDLMTGVLSGGNDGGSLAGLAAVLRYSRDAEEEADRLAVDWMIAAEIDPMGFKSFFARLLKEEQASGNVLGEWGSLLSTHPGTEERINKVVPLPEGVAARAILTDAQWQAMKNMCED